MVSIKVLSLTLLVFLVNCSDCYHVLLVFNLPGKSLSILGESFVRHLLNAGHEVTYVTPFPMKNKPKNNFHEVDVSEGVDKLFAEICNITFLLENTHFESDEEEIMHLGVEVAEMTLTNPNMLKLLNDKSQKFDVVVGDYLASELVAGIAYYYDCPMIWSYSMGVDSAILKLVHEPTNPSYIPDYISLNIPPMSFKQRVGELWTLIRNTWVKRHSVMPRELAFYKKFYKSLLEKKGKPLPAYEDVMYNASLVLVNSHQASGGLAAIPQSVKLIGGHHINGPVAPLPDDLKEIMDSSTNGVIYFSMGSIWKSASMPITLRDNLVRMFGSLKQTVLWKFEEDIPNLPKNIHTLKWAPQHSILAHENCMLFITHGGLGSSTEALHFGVPIVGVPISFDQFLNINRAVSKGYALSVKLSYNLHNDLKVAIDTIATDPSFKSNAKALSEIYHDRPVKPAVEIPHWVRHVVRTRGAPHLRSPALMVPWYQKTYLDLSSATPPWGRPRSMPAAVSTADVPVQPNSPSMSLRNCRSSGSSHVSCSPMMSDIRHSCLIFSTERFALLQLKLTKLHVKHSIAI